MIELTTLIGTLWGLAWGWLIGEAYAFNVVIGWSRKMRVSLFVATLGALFGAVWFLTDSSLVDVESMRLPGAALGFGVVVGFLIWSRLAVSMTIDKAIANELENVIDRFVGWK